MVGQDLGEAVGAPGVEQVGQELEIREKPRLSAVLSNYPFLLMLVSYSTLHLKVKTNVSGMNLTTTVTTYY